MRKEEIGKLGLPYSNSASPVDRRFNSGIGADVPSSKRIVEELLDDLDEHLFGIRWWKSLPDEERILIGDYMYQCAEGIETNLIEAKLHIFEWLDAREKENKRIENAVSVNSDGAVQVKLPPAKSPLDDLPSKMDAMHICGFFRAIGSSLDCLAAIIIAVLALPISLRKASIGLAE